MKKYFMDIIMLSSACKSDYAPLAQLLETYNNSIISETQREQLEEKVRAIIRRNEEYFHLYAEKSFFGFRVVEIDGTPAASVDYRDVKHDFTLDNNEAQEGGEQ